MPAAPVPPPRRRRRWGAAVFVSIAFGLLIALIVILLVQSDFGDDGKTVPLLDVPKVTSELFPTAEATLVNQGFKVVRVDKDSTLPSDTVLQQDPEAGLRLRKGGTITLDVSSATVAAARTIVGKNRAEATAHPQAEEHPRRTSSRRTRPTSRPAPCCAPNPARAHRSRRPFPS